MMNDTASQRAMIVRREETAADPLGRPLCRLSRSDAFGNVKDEFFPQVLARLPSAHLPRRAWAEIRRPIADAALTCVSAYLNGLVYRPIL